MLEYLDFELKRGSEDLNINSPGIYFFHVKPNKMNLVTLLEKVIHQQRKKVLIASDNERQSLKYYVGITSASFTTKFNNDYLLTNQKLVEVLQFLFKTKTPPLYIGMSNNLGSRLSTHMRNLKYLFKQINSIEFNRFIDPNAFEDIDNSLNFVNKFQRLMQDLNTIPNIKLPSENSVYFEYIKLENINFSFEDIRELETILININHPILNTKYK